MRGRSGITDFTNVRDLLWSFKEVSSSDKSLVPDTNAQYVANLL